MSTVSPTRSAGNREEGKTAMTDPFEIALAEVLRAEGGYSNDPQDPGGETRWGISKRAHPELDIRALTREQASAVYRADYWDTVRCGEFPARVAIALFDSAVNQGPAAAVRLLQEALGASADGVVGKQTIAAAFATDSKLLLVAFLARRATHYASLPTFSRFGLGWMRRLFALQQACLLMAEPAVRSE